MESPRILIQSPNAIGEILSTETGDGIWKPKNSLNDDVRHSLENLPDRELYRLLDSTSNEFQVLSVPEFTRRFAEALKKFLVSCENHEADLVRTLGRDPAIIVSEDLAEKLGIQSGKRFVSSFLEELDALPLPSISDMGSCKSDVEEDLDPRT